MKSIIRKSKYYRQNLRLSPLSFWWKNTKTLNPLRPKYKPFMRKVWNKGRYARYWLRKGTFA